MSRNRSMFSSLNRSFSVVVRSGALLALLGVLVSFGAPVASAQFQTISVEQILNPDGTLNWSAGGSSALDLHGWDVALDSQRGPILTQQGDGSEPLPIQARDPHARSGTVDPAVPLAPTWQALPHQGLYGGNVYALAFIGSDLYVGGNFFVTQDSAITLNRIAKFSGGVWSALPNNGLDDGVYALAVSGSDLYVGGFFTQTADGKVTNLNGIAKFSTTSKTWSALPNNGLKLNEGSLQVNAEVRALAFIGSDLYVGGYFDRTFDGAVTNLNRIAKFDGKWSELPNKGLNFPTVFALAVNGSDLYVGGQFTHTADCNIFPQTTCVSNLNYIAKFSTSANTWSALPSKGLDNTVFALAFIGSDLYVGGYSNHTADCDDASPPPITCVRNLNRIAKFSTSTNTWSALPHNGLNTDEGLNQVDALAVSGSDLYVGGHFAQTYDGKVTNLNKIAKFSYDANTWSALPNYGLNHGVYAFAVNGSDLYVGGQFNGTFDGAVTNLTGIAKLSPSPAVTSQPSNQTVSAGSSASFTATANGDPSPSVQWQVSTNGGATFNNIVGATNTTYTFVAQASDNGNLYHAVFTNSAGTATSNNASLTVNSKLYLPLVIK